MVITVQDPEAPSSVKEEISHDHLFKVTGLSSSNLEKLGQVLEQPSDFEDAIAATGYGKFNVYLMLCTLPGFWSSVSVTSSISYIFTRAQCDMNLSLLDMGTITAMTYAGMISSAMIWGFLSDTLGRKKIMVWGFIGAGLVEMTAAMSQSFAMLLVTRFASGFLFNGPFAVLISYLAELHRTDLRARVILLTGLFYTLANITLPLLAWALLNNDWEIHLLSNVFIIRSWNVFLFATGLAPLLTGLVFLNLPESPKFLMSRGRNDEAMAIFRNIYSMNTGNKEDDYPIKKLVEEKQEHQGRGVEALRGGCAQLAPLFKPPHLKWLLLVCTVHAGAMFGSNTIRLWYPQLAAMISSDATESLCSAIAPTPPPSPEGEVHCVPTPTDMLTYLQSAAVGAGSILTYAIGGVLINKCGKKSVSGFCSIASALMIAMIPYFGTSSLAVVGTVTTALSFTALCSASLSSIAVDLFPTSLRVMALATFLMTGRLGTITGTVTFPALMDYGCLPPFITIAAVLAGQLGGANSTSSQQGHAVTSRREYFGPQPFAKEILTERGSTGPMCGSESAGGGHDGSNIHRQCPGATRHTSSAFAAAASSAGELTNTGSWLRLYSHTPSDSNDRVTPRPILARVFRTWNRIYKLNLTYIHFNLFRGSQKRI